MKKINFRELKVFSFLKDSEKYGNLLSILYILTLAAPIVALNRFHDCVYSDNCMRIYYEEERGACVFKKVDDICVVLMTIVIFCPFIWTMDKKAISPFIAVALTGVVSFNIAEMDPSKWLFFFSIIFNLVVMVLVYTYNQKHNFM